MREIQINIDKPGRRYFIRSRTFADGSQGFCVDFKPINPRTGLPWQASRSLTYLAQSVFCAGRYGNSVGCILPEPPSVLPHWYKSPELQGRFDWCVGYIRSEAAARALVESHWASHPAKV
jgi:hypothetical protein